jgi:hypothetical protein
MGEQTKKPPKAKPSTPSEPIVPIRRSSFSYTPSHQKYSTPPKKGEGEFPPPMSLDQAVDEPACPED